MRRSRSSSAIAHQAQSAVSPAASGACSGTFWDALIRDDLPDPLARAAIGASLGALGGALADVSIDGQFIKDAGQKLQTGIAAIFLLLGAIGAATHGCFAGGAIHQHASGIGGAESRLPL